MAIKIKTKVKTAKAPKGLKDTEYMPRTQQLPRDEKYARSAGQGKGKAKKI